MPIDPNKTISELLKNASTRELKTLAEAVTPFVPGANPPQFMDLNNQSVIGILEKYGIVETTAGKTPVNVHPSLGEIKSSTEYDRVNQTFVTVNFIVPTQNSTNLANSGAPKGTNNASPFDYITVEATSRLISDAEDNWDKTIKAGWDTKDIIPMVTTDRDGKSTVTYLKVDPEETKRYRQKDPNAPTQYKIINPPRTETVITPNRSKAAKKFSEEELDYTEGQINGGDQSAGTMSPAGKLTSNLIQLQTNVNKVDEMIKAGESATSLNVQARLYNINAISTKVAGVVSVSFDSTGYDAVLSNYTTRGHSAYSLKNTLTIIRQIYNLGKGVGYTITGLVNLTTGSPDKALDNFEDGAKYFAKEGLAIPLYNKTAEALGKALVTPFTIRASNAPKAPRDRRRTSTGILKIVDDATQLDANLSKKLGTTQSGGLISLNNRMGAGGKLTPKWITGEEQTAVIGSLNAGAKAGAATRTANIIGAAGYVIYFGVPLVLDPGKYEDEMERAKLHQAIDENPGITQKGIARATNGQLVIDDDDISAVNPYTGDIVTVKLPPCLPKPPSPTSIVPYIQEQKKPESFLTGNGPASTESYMWIPSWTDVGSQGYYQLPDVEASAKLSDYQEEPSWLEKMAMTLYHGVGAFFEYVSKLPDLIQIGGYAQGVAQTYNLLTQFGTTEVGKRLGFGSGWFAKVGTWTEETVLKAFTKYGEGTVALLAKGLIYIDLFIEMTLPVNSSEAEWILKQNPIEFAKAQIRLIDLAIAELTEKLYALSDGNSEEAFKLREQISELQKSKKDYEDRLKKLNEKASIYKNGITREPKTGGIRIKTKTDETVQNENSSQALPIDKDPSLASNACFCLEVEEAKLRHDVLHGILSELTEIGDNILSGSIPIPPHKWPVSGSSFVVCQPTDKVSCEKKPPGFLNTPKNLPAPILPTCFPEYILVKTNNGMKKISEFSVGDNVISFNFDGNFEEDLVSEVFVHNDAEIYRYHFDNGNHIDITKEHPVFISNDKFVEIGKLNIGDSILDITGEFLKITKFEFLSKDTVYNIEVEKNHTYIAEGIRVHNKLGIKGPPPNWSLGYILTSPDPENNRPDLQRIGDPPRDPNPTVTDTPPPTTGEISPNTPDGGPPVGGTIPDQDPFENSPGGSAGTSRIPKEIIFDGCFTSDCLVKTPTGRIKIETIEVGQEIFAFNFEGNPILTKVKKKFIHEEDKFEVKEYILTDGTKLKATPNHSVLTIRNNKKIFSRLEDLNINDVLITENNESMNIVEINSIGKLPVYHILPENGDLISINSIFVDIMDIIY